MSDGEFSVCQFFANDTHEYVRRFIDVKDAVQLAFQCARSVAAQTGIVDRVIITDGGDNTVFEWTFDDGVTYPPKARETHG